MIDIKIRCFRFLRSHSAFLTRKFLTNQIASISKFEFCAKSATKWKVMDHWSNGSLITNTSLNSHLINKFLSYRDLKKIISSILLKNNFWLSAWCNLCLNVRYWYGAHNIVLIIKNFCLKFCFLSNENREIRWN